MRTWENYKKTMATESIMFEHARNGDVDALRALDLSADELQKEDVKGYTVLMLAAYHGHEELTQFLLKLGANPNTKDQSGKSVLMGAAFKGNLKIVKMLIGSGADRSAKSPKDLTAEGFADMFGRTEVALYLRENSY